MIEIKCKTQDTLSLSDLVEFQGNLKECDENDVAKIVKSINKHSFEFPFFVWKHDRINHVLEAKNSKFKNQNGYGHAVAERINNIEKKYF